MNERVLLGVCMAVIAVAYLILALEAVFSGSAKPGQTEHRVACGLAAAGTATLRLLPPRVVDEPTTLRIMTAVLVVAILLFCRAGYLTWKRPKRIAR